MMGWLSRLFSSGKSRLSISVEEEGYVSILYSDESLYLSGTGAKLYHAVVDLIRQGESRFLIDLSAVGFVDNGGVGRLVSTEMAVRAAGGRIAWLKPGARAANLVSDHVPGGFFDWAPDKSSAIVELIDEDDKG